MKISLVIPVYNVEKYLARCLDSCLHQDLAASEYEIVVVNDGSPDGSKKIAEKYASDFANIKLYNQENGGLSVARNNGFKKAIGKYVWFIDSDDWIVENCLSEVVEKMEAEKLDMLQIGFMEAFEDGSFKPSNRGFFEGCKSGCDVMKERYVPAPAQFTVYNRSFLERFRIEFYPGIYHEDAEFKPRALFYAKRFASLKQHVYYYFQRTNGSIMSRYSVKRGVDMLTVCDNLCSFEEITSMPLDFRREFDYVITVYLTEFFKGIQKLDSDSKKYLIQLFEGDKNLLKSIKNSKNRKHRLAGRLLSISVPLGVNIITKFL